MSVERRLGAQARPVRVFVAPSVCLGTLAAVAVLLQAWLLAGLVSTSFTARVGPGDLVGLGLRGVPSPPQPTGGAAADRFAGYA